MERAELKRWGLATGCAETRGEFVFLRDPGWSSVEQAQVDVAILDFGRAKPPAEPRPIDGLNVSSLSKRLGETPRPTYDPLDDKGWLCIPTGGTSGGVRFARHDEQTLGAAVRGFCAHFGIQRVNAVGVLPPHHVSGLMARVRCVATGGIHVDWSWKQLEAGGWPEVETDAENWFLSLVPTQLQRLLANAAAVERLRRFRAVFIGGGPLWPALAELAALARVPISTSYGMTETAAMIAAQLPENFALGERDCGVVMPHAKIEIVDEATGAALPAGETGVVRIDGESLFRGYWPERTDARIFLTEDLGCVDSRGHLRIVGRRDAVIITGGKKVHPAEVEAVLRASGEFADVAVIGLADEVWGQIVVACFPEAETPAAGKVEAALAALASYKRPKRFLALATWPRNAQGKLNRAALAAAMAFSPR